MYSLQAVTANGIAGIVLLFLLLSFRKKFGTKKDDLKTFYCMLLVNLFQCVVEAMCIVLDGVLFPGAIVLTTALNALLYIGTVVFAALWMTYAELRVQGHASKFTKQQLLKYIPAVLIILGAVVNLFTPVYFQITAENRYQRSWVFLIAYFISYLYLIIGSVSVYGFKHRKDRYVMKPAVIFLLPVFVASILQYLFPGISLLWAGAAISMTFAYVSLLDESIAIDPVSGTFTQHYMRKDLNHLVNQPRESNVVAGIMLDIDHLRQVNENFGYSEGEKFIRKTGRLLRNTVDDKGTVYRYAGGVFTIILHTDDTAVINELLVAIGDEVVLFNARKESPVPLRFSVGYTMMAPGETTSDFLSRLEKAVQDDKRSKHQKDSSYKDLNEFYQFNPNRNRVLIVNGNYMNREILKNIFPAQFRVLEVVNTQEALSQLDVYANSICAILIDYDSPGLDALNLLDILHQRHITRIIPTFLITEKESYDVAQQAYSLGVVDVITNPFMPYVILQRVQSVLALFQARESIQATAMAEAPKSNEGPKDTELPVKVQEPPAEKNETLASAIEFRDIESGEHTNRIYNITKHLLLYTKMGEDLSPEEIENIAIGSILHDIGKIAIADTILNKPGRLTKDEFEIMKSHTVKGAELVEQLAKSQAHPSYQYAIDIARHHHERWDGGGYPDGLKGEQITVWAQVASLADAYDALVSRRVYKKEFSPDVAVEMICSGECGVFNPKLLKCFRQVEQDFRVWYEIPQTETSAVKQLIHQTGPEQDMINVMLLIDAVRINHDQVIYGNLSKNTYTMIGSEVFPFHKRRKNGAFDQLIQEVGRRVPSSHRNRFLETFSREKLLRDYAEGTKNVSLGYPELLDGGDLRIVFTTVLLMEDAHNGDVLEITLIRYVDQ